MIETVPSLQQAQAAGQAQPSTVIAPAIRASMSRAFRVLARQAAIKEANRRLQSQGLKLSRFLHREIVVMAEEIVLADAQLPSAALVLR
jgi:hypothetical protein